ncbi:MAG: YidH family protein [Nitriliruptoraceae bacterium]
MAGDRWPARLYDQGAEPDPRFSLANERTVLAWLRTALALVVAGIAIIALEELLDTTLLIKASAAVCFLGGAATALIGYRQWYRAERALRRNEPLPAASVTVFVLLVIVALAAIGAIGLLTRIG